MVVSGAVVLPKRADAYYYRKWKLRDLHLLNGVILFLFLSVSAEMDFKYVE